MRALIEHGADVKAQRSWDAPGLGGGEQALAWSNSGGDRRTINYLIEHGAKSDPTNSFSPIESAALYGDLETTRRLPGSWRHTPTSRPPQAESEKFGLALNDALLATTGKSRCCSSNGAPTCVRLLRSVMEPRRAVFSLTTNWAMTWWRARSRSKVWI